MGKMGLTKLKLQVGNPSHPKRTETLEFLVDSGAVYSIVPSPILKKLGVKPMAKQEFRLADGNTIIRKKGIAMFRYQKYVGGADVIFGEPDDAQVLGAFTLEGLGLALDPIHRRLIELPMVI